ncbi:MAG: MFS transporter [Desulfurococcales archaeon]|nr:MFS transporter [Desulfurococcales archaeon]
MGLRLQASIRVFILLSLVSMFADMAYEGARSIVGPYLRHLDAVLIVAAAVSIGDLVSYTARLAGGLVVHAISTSRAYWGMVMLGYVINLAAVPLLALARSWEAVFALVMVERLGKGLRAPARDTILAEVSRGIGRGLAFSIHEVLDQAGGVTGPLIVGLLASREGYSFREAFLALTIPAVVAVALLLAAYSLYPRVKSARRGPGEGGSLSLGFVVVALSGFLAMAGFVHWVQASYRLSYLGLGEVAYLYSIAMLIDAVSALALGVLYDRLGPATVALVPVMACTATILLWHGSPVAFAAAWGAAMGGFESVYRSLVADSLEPGARGLGFGVAYFSMGAGWAVGNLLISALDAMALPIVTLLEAGSIALILAYSRLHS